MGKDKKKKKKEQKGKLNRLVFVFDELVALCFGTWVLRHGFREDVEL